MKRKLALLVLSSVVALVAAEGVTRLVYSPRTHSKRAVFDEELGWASQSGVTWTGEVKDLAGKTSECRFTTTRSGFREYGDPATQVRPKVLFLGDSFTHSVAVSNDETFFGLIAAELELEVFAHGQSGYGTLQELLVFEQHAAEIQPHLTVLQVCDNDFIDNHVELERQATYNLGLRRPYMAVDGSIQHHVPGHWAEDLMSRLRFGAWLVHRSSALTALKQPRLTNAETRINLEGAGYPPFTDSLRITSKIIERMAQHAESQGSQLVAFSASAFQPQLMMFESTFAYRGVAFSDAAAVAVEAAKSAGTTVNTADGWHWSNTGHRIAARALMPFIREHLERPRSINHQPGLRTKRLR